MREPVSSGLFGRSGQQWPLNGANLVRLAGFPDSTIRWPYEQTKTGLHAECGRTSLIDSSMHSCRSVGSAANSRGLFLGVRAASGFRNIRRRLRGESGRTTTIAHQRCMGRSGGQVVVRTTQDAARRRHPAREQLVWSGSWVRSILPKRLSISVHHAADA